MARVLVVDDAAVMRALISDVLTAAGHEVVAVCADGEQAVQRYLQLRPDLTTLDITMPVKDGIEALREIVAHDPSARVVVCSALGQEDKVLAAVRAGARDFVVKPLQGEQLLTAAARALA